MAYRHRTDVLTTGQVAVALTLSQDTVARMIDTDVTLRGWCTVPGKQRRVPREAVREYVHGRSET